MVLNFKRGNLIKPACYRRLERLNASSSDTVEILNLDRLLGGLNAQTHVCKLKPDKRTYLVSLTGIHTVSLPPTFVALRSKVYSTEPVFRAMHGQYRGIRTAYSWSSSLATNYRIVGDDIISAYVLIPL